MTWRIGGLEIDGRVILAPMSGYTSRAYRRFMKPFGVAADVSEMVSAMGLIRGTDRSWEYIGSDARPSGVQLFGSDPETVARAASAALDYDPDIDFIDINMGCPVNKIARSLSGAVMMKDPANCGAVVRAVKKAVDVPVTAKIRLGQSASSENYPEVISELEAAGVDCIALHARTREERYTGDPHWDEIAGLGKEMSVPLVVSGSIYTLADAVKAVRTSCARGVMVARGGVGNPFLVTQIDRYFWTGEVLPCPTVSQQAAWCRQLIGMVLDEKGPEEGFMRLRSYVPRFAAGIHGCRMYRKELACSADVGEMLRILGELEDAVGGERIRPGGSGGMPEPGPDGPGE
ncbi:tRNA-dihydrouridine synthase [Candidatus Methanomethylophilus sp. 1R26]|uniref:tRNA dihydrouridine synthase n=1 Tax=Candidatus Methanomethylophilus sp. 1R26 TaxID=1769296 RepID=UPI000A710CE7|nr:tRNA-dihydrouridine synthase [Candidatus Methanomethylophilus sp. 1R26]